MRLIAIGRIGAGPEAMLFARYAARLNPPFTVTELPAARGTPTEAKRREAAAMLAALPREAFAVVLDQGGAIVDSTGLARLLSGWRDAGRRLAFLIGGADGLDASVLARADDVLSLGKLTWPHLLARALLAEQLYRAQSILAGHPYHRAFRPGDAASRRLPRRRGGD